MVLPDAGRILLVNPSGDDDLAVLPGERLAVVQGFRPDHDALAARGFRVTPTVPDGLFASALVCLPRARDAARAQIRAAIAAVAAGGLVSVDGQKTDGVEALEREVRARVPLTGTVAKAHGRLFSFAASPGFADWAPMVRRFGGFTTQPGVFSSDAPDPGSALLAAALPAKLPGRGVDLGAGWGYLANAVLARAGVTHVDLVEADHAALACARLNVTDPRAAFHWADATTFRPARLADWVVMNPPFHSGRTADPALGTAFIAAAARMLAPSGTLWLVANRHLPYGPVLETLFRKVEDLPAAPAFRLTAARLPTPPERRKGPR